MVKRKIDRTPKPIRLSRFFAKKNTYYLLLVLVITSFALSPSLTNGFTNWDDDLYVVNNQSIRSIDSTGLKKMGDDYVGNYHPVTMISYALDFRKAELDPARYHRTNLIFHLLNTILVFILLMRLTKGNFFIAIFTTLLFGIHPMHVESVTWIAERKDVLYTFFFLIGLIFYYEFVLRKKWPYLVAAGLVFVLSVLSKSAAVVFPLVLILIDYFESRKFSYKTVLEKLPFFAISIWIGLVAIRTQQATGAVGDIEVFSLFDRLRFASYGFINYIEKFFVPWNLSAIHPYPDPNNIPLIYNLYLIGAIVVFGASILFFMRKLKWLVFGLYFYFVTIFLVLQFISVGDAVVAERYTYVPYIGIGFIYLYLLDLLLKRKQKLKRIVISALVLQCGFLAYTTFQQTKVWKSSYTLWTNVIEKYPDNSRAYSNRGHSYRSEKKPNESRSDYNKAIELDSMNFQAYSNRAVLYFENSRFEEALADYNSSLNINGDYFHALSGRGATYAALDEWDSALSDFTKALELYPENYTFYDSRGMVYMNLGEFGLAIRDFKKFQEFEPRNPDVFHSIAACLHKTGDYAMAIFNINQAILVDKVNGSYYYLRSVIFRDMGNMQRAYGDVQRADAVGFEVPQEYLDEFK